MNWCFTVTKDPYRNFRCIWLEIYCMEPYKSLKKILKQDMISKQIFLWNVERLCVISAEKFSVFETFIKQFSRRMPPVLRQSQWTAAETKSTNLWYTFILQLRFLVKMKTEGRPQIWGLSLSSGLPTWIRRGGAVPENCSNFVNEFRTTYSEGFTENKKD